MRRSTIEAILKAYNGVKHNIPDDAPVDMNTPLLVNFRLGDIRMPGARDQERRQHECARRLKCHTPVQSDNKERNEP